MHIKKLFQHLSVVGVLLSSSLTYGGTVTSSITVTAAVAASCTITASPLSFGNYTLALIQQSTTLSVTCTNGTAYNIGLNAGTGAGATVTTRKMTCTGGGACTSGTDTLSYSLTSVSYAGSNWGATIGTDTVTGTGSGAAQSITVYGTVPASQTSPTGNYSDTVVATITF